MLSKIPEDHQEDPGEIVEISTNPWHSDQVMIGYSAGFMMVWDLAAQSLLNILKSPVNLQHFCWKSEDEFYSSHSDGNYTLWDAENGAQIEVFAPRVFWINLTLMNCRRHTVPTVHIPVPPSTSSIAKKQRPANGLYSGEVNSVFIYWGDTELLREYIQKLTY